MRHTRLALQISFRHHRDTNAVIAAVGIADRARLVAQQPEEQRRMQEHRDAERHPEGPVAHDKRLHRSLGNKPLALLRRI